jgi:class 3 adenylate cyclase
MAAQNARTNRLSVAETGMPQMGGLCAFVPQWLIESLAEHSHRPCRGGYCEAPCAVLIADISGFSRLADRLDAMGPLGAETLARILDASFSSLIGTIHAHGGDVLRFAGDALIVAFRANTNFDLAACVQNACRCALQAHAQIRERSQDEPLALRIAIAHGQVRLFDIGGVDQRWEFLAAGPPLLEVARAEHLARPGETIIDAATRRFLALGDRVEPAENGYFRVLACHDSTPSANSLNKIGAFDLADTRVRPYLPPTLVRRLEAGQSKWLAEFREVTVLLINLPGAEFRSGARLDEFQEIFRDIQSSLHAQDGDASQVVADDKGLVIVAPFGLPLIAHEDDAARAVAVGLDLATRLAARGITYRIGIASGRAFCGTYGPAQRREAVTVGTTVNRASRLADAANEGILCDEETMRRSTRRRLFRALPPIRVKGSSEPLPVFFPEGERRLEISRAKEHIVGREDEIQFIQKTVHALRDHNESGVLYIEGEAGVGKSILLQYACSIAQELTLRTAYSHAQIASANTPYAAWRQILVQLFELEHLSDADQRSAHMQRILERHCKTPEWGALLNSILPVSMPISDAVRDMAAALRGPNTRELLVELVVSVAEDAPIFVVLDDAQWLDASSRSFTLALSRTRAGLVIGLATRSLDAASDPLLEVRDDPQTNLMKIERMDANDVKSVVCQHLHVHALPSAIGNIIATRAQGHPLFAVELASSLRDTRLIEVRQQTCTVLADVAEIERVVLPSTIQGILNSRLDHLDPAQQMVLKVASVLGGQFSQELVEAIYPITNDHADLQAHIDDLVARDLLIVSAEGNAEPLRSGFSFRHVMMQEAAYNLLPFGQRSDLHRRAAKHMESLADDQSWPIIAQHWALGGERTNARIYFDRAGEASLRSGANREAIALLQRSRELEDAGEPQRVTISRTVSLAHAYLGCGDVVNSESLYHNALASLGTPVANSSLARAGGLIKESLRQIAHLFVPPRRREGERGKEHGLRAQAASGAAELSFYNLDTTRFIHLSLLTTHESELADTSLTVVVSGYTVLGYMSAFGGLSKLSERYFAKAKDTHDATTLAHAENSQGSVLFLRNGSGTEHIVRAYVRARAVRDRRVMSMCLEIGRLVCEFRNPALAWPLAKAGLAIANGYNAQQTLWHLHGKVSAQLHQGLALESVNELRQATLDSSSAEPGLLSRHACLLGAAVTAIGPRKEALELVSAAGATLLPSRNPSDMGPLWHHFHACLSLCDSSMNPEEKAHFERLIEQAAQAIYKFARSFRVAEGRALEVRSILLQRANRNEAARSWLERALHVAQKLALYGDEVRLRRSLARLLPSPQAMEQERAALEIETMLSTYNDPLASLLAES